MSQNDRARVASAARTDGRFVLYLEGPRDRAILSAWSRRFLSAFDRKLFQSSVILGGRQPARAIAHFRRVNGSRGAIRALCVLDRDDGANPEPGGSADLALEFYIWSRRHIESYLLVPAAIRRALHTDNGRVDRVLRDHLPDDGDEESLRSIDAKRLLAPGGALSQALGRSLPLLDIARAMHAEELHADVHDLFSRLRGETARARRGQAGA